MAFLGSPSFPPNPPQLLHEQVPSPSGLQSPSGFSLEHLAALINHARGLMSPTAGGQSPSGVMTPGGGVYGQNPALGGGPSGGVGSPSAGGVPGPIGSPFGSPTAQPGTYPPAPAGSPSGGLPGSPSANPVPAAPYSPSSGSPSEPGGFLHPAGPIDPNQLAALRAIHGPGGFSTGPGAVQHRLGNDARAAQLWEARHPDALASGRFIPGWMRAYLAQHSANNTNQAQ